MKKWIKRILLTLLAVFLISGAVLACLGYSEYRNALEEEGLSEKIDKIRRDSDYVKSEDLPEIYLQAVVAVEDHRFREHGGVDMIAILRALKNDILSGSLKEGKHYYPAAGEKSVFYRRKNRGQKSGGDFYGAETGKRVQQRGNP